MRKVDNTMELLKQTFDVEVIVFEVFDEILLLVAIFWLHEQSEKAVMADNKIANFFFISILLYKYIFLLIFVS